MNPLSHREAQDALPWLANGTLADVELERVQAHLEACAACRADLALLHTLRAAGPGAAPDCDVERALARVLPRLDAPQDTDAARTPAPAPELSRMPPPLAPQSPVTPGWRARLAANDGSWLRVAVALQCCVIAGLAALLARPGAPQEPAGAYRVLGASQGAKSSMLVTFQPDTPERELRRIVLASGARVAGGPTATGAWLLDTEQQAAAVVARLRAEPAVTLAEPLGMDAGTAVGGAAEGRP